jgi:hypothetical protein
LTGPDELRRAALESVLQWHYSPAALSNVSTQVVLRFHLPPPGAARPEAEAVEPEALRIIRKLHAERTFITNDGQTFRFRTSEPLESDGKGSEMSAHQRAEHMMAEMREAIENPQTPTGEKEELKRKLDDLKREFEERRDQENANSARAQNGQAQLARVRTERVADGMASEILAKAGVSVGSIVSEESFKRIRTIAAQADEHLRVEFGRDETGGVVLTFITR